MGSRRDGQSPADPEVGGDDVTNYVFGYLKEGAGGTLVE